MRDQIGIERNKAYYANTKEIAKELNVSEITIDTNSDTYKEMKELGINTQMPVTTMTVGDQRYTIKKGEEIIANALHLGIEFIWVLVVDWTMDEKSEPKNENVKITEEIAEEFTQKVEEKVITEVIILNNRGKGYKNKKSAYSAASRYAKLHNLNNVTREYIKVGDKFVIKFVK